MSAFLLGSVAVMVVLSGLAIGAAVANERKHDCLASLLVLSAAVVFAGALVYLARMSEVGAQ